jgi:flagellar motor switch protein FliG
MIALKRNFLKGYNFLKESYGVLPPKPYKFINKPLKSSLEQDLTEIITVVGNLIPQLSNFVDQFNDTIIQKCVNVITDVQGNMAIDVPSAMPDDEATELSKRINVLDRVIKARSQEIQDLVEKGIKIETKLKTENPQFHSIILEKADEFRKINNSYRH